MTTSHNTENPHTHFTSSLESYEVIEGTIRNNLNYKVSLIDSDQNMNYFANEQSAKQNILFLTKIGCI